MDQAILYISVANLRPEARQCQLANIEAVALSRNGELDLTGILVATPTHFAQFLQGDANGLAAAMTSIRADTRHFGIDEVSVPGLTKRLYPNWRMACFDPNNFSSRFLDPIVAEHYGHLSEDCGARLLAALRRLVPASTRPPRFGI